MHLQLPEKPELVFRWSRRDVQSNLTVLVLVHSEVVQIQPERIEIVVAVVCTDALVVYRMKLVLAQFVAGCNCRSIDCYIVQMASEEVVEERCTAVTVVRTMKMIVAALEEEEESTATSAVAEELVENPRVLGESEVERT